MRIKLCVLIIFVTNTILAQEIGTKKLNGKVNANTLDLEGIYVINLKTEKSTITEKEGYFTIDAKPGDSLLFSAIHLKEVRICLTQNDFQKEEFEVKMETNVHQLKEAVILRYDNINAVALGISPSGIKHRTAAERKLYTATSTSGDALLNFMSGRTAMLKKEILVENKLSCIQLIENLFPDEHFIKDFKIPIEYVNGFKYYMVENEKFTTVLKQKNKFIIDFLIGELAIKYNEIITCENE